MARNQAFAAGNGRNFNEVVFIKNACAATNVGLSTYYKYRKLYEKYSGDRNEIATRLHRKNCQRTDPQQYHLLDTLMMRFYACNDSSSSVRAKLLRPSTMYNLAMSLMQRTGHLWLDLEKIKLAAPHNLVEELLDHRIPMSAILDNPEKSALLKPTSLPSRSRFYEYLNWYKAHPDTGKGVIVSRHGQEFWDNNFLIYDNFVSLATYPLQYVFVDHWLMDVFIVDEETRSKVTRLWLTVLIDAYTRCILGFALNYEDPCIESIQSALFHAIWPKTSHKKYGITREWVAYGIPIFLSMDNAWAHHSKSLENLSRIISDKGKWNSITLVFRPPYKGRYGALIERYFLSLSDLFKQTLPGAILSSHPKDVQNAARKACLLYQDIDQLIHKIMVDYQHSPHSELNNVTPEEKWLQATQFSPIMVPPLTDKTDRLFWRLFPDTRQIPERGKGVSLFGMHYTSNSINDLGKIGKGGQPVEYNITYKPEDISIIALLRDGKWVGDLYAKELKQPDGSYRAISLWEKEIARNLANADQKSSRDWLAYINDVDEMATSRQAQKTKRHRNNSKTSILSNQPKTANAQDVVNISKAIEVIQSSSENNIPDYSKYLREFASE